MIKLKLTKVIANTLVIASVLVLNPIGVSAEWKQSSNGLWWYEEGSSWATGWRQIEGEYYYFDTNGYMLSNVTTPDGYYVGYDGVATNFMNSQSDFTFDSVTGTITAYNGTDVALVIPSVIDGVNVKIIGDEAFRWCDSLISVTIPNGVTSIEKRAFYGCSSLTSITIPDSVTSIKDSAFNKCSSLTSITIPNGVKSIKVNEFDGCTSLISITIPNSVTSIENREMSPDGERINPFHDCKNATFYVKSEATKQLLVKFGVNKSKIIVSA